jgi:cysteinyl-tRNA synthetase
MPLSLYDTLSREKIPFIPYDSKRVTLYVCGPTVYNPAHVGNARPYVVFDVLYRLLRRDYGPENVIYARNITDVDDKINKKAADEGVPISVITERYADIFHQDMDSLAILRPSIEPRVTASMTAIISQIKALIANGHAYVGEDHVLFDVNTYNDYGALSRRSLDDMIAGARVEVAPYKKNPQDFVLWKPSKPHEPFWPSPWGNGRPGWHIECSAMIEANLGFPIDIHAGGHDLIFPHHENEIAQGVCAHDHKASPQAYARHWMHNGFLTMNSEKMSKSIGNVHLVHELTKTLHPEIIRLSLLSASYRAPLDWTSSLLDQSRARLDGLYGALRRYKRLNSEGTNTIFSVPQSIQDALEDDLNTPMALAELGRFAQSLETAKTDQDRRDAYEALRGGAEALGLLNHHPDDWFGYGLNQKQRQEIDQMVSDRLEARKSKNWTEADRLRDLLSSRQIELMDRPDGCDWKVKYESL